MHAQVPVDVASFLLNEKRAEIQKLEGRLKVNIVMVPNPHLETPHYKVQRLRHDELNEMEHVPSSYEMVEQPEEPKAPGAETAEAKLERQQPVVKSITPAQPAPLPSEPRREKAPEPVAIVQPVAAAASAGVGLLSRFLSIFKPLPTAAPVQTAPQAPASAIQAAQPHREHHRRDQQRRDGGRRDGGRRDERREGRGGGDRQQHGRLEQRRNGQQRGEQRGERGEQRGERAEQRQGGRQEQRPQQHQQRPPQQQPQAQQQQQQQQPRPERDGDERRGGRRHRRDRGDRQPRGEQRPQQADAHAQSIAAIAEQQRRIHELESARIEELRHAEPAPEVRAAEPPPPPPAPRIEEPRVEEPRIDAQQLLSDSGLVMVETDRAKVPVQPPVVEEQPQAVGRPRRERPKSLAQDEELVQVETTRK